MSFEQFKEYISGLISGVYFQYNEKKCGIDPLSHTEFDMWYGEKIHKFTSIENVFASPFFDGKTIAEIFDMIDLEW